MYQFSVTEMHDFQKQDSDLKNISQWLEQEKLPSKDEVAQFSPAVKKVWLNLDSITLKDGNIYRKLTLADNKEVQQLLVPKLLRQNILEMCHNDLFSANQGVNKTIYKLNERFYWYRMRAIKCHVKQCSTCNKREKTTSKVVWLSSWLFLRQSRNLCQWLLPRIKKHNKFILAIGDHFTRWMKAFHIPNQNAETVATKFVHEFIVSYRTPLEIHSGIKFDSQFLKEVCFLLQIKKTRSTPYRPNSTCLKDSTKP